MVRTHFLVGLKAVLVLTVLTGLLYPLAVTATAQVAFGDKADGQLVRKDGKVVGANLIGQAFTQERYFQTRPSSAGAAASGSFVDVTDDDGYPTGATEPADPADTSLASSSGSNLGPTNEDYLKTVEERVAAYREANGLAGDVPVPADAVTASGSGLDPHISVANARLQAKRVARVRSLDPDAVLKLVDKYTEHRAFGLLGEDGVNVLQLNLALDRLK